ncbi:MAG: hypothetical protein RMA76_21375 [Deltaproteobacteria bacterium]
MIIEASIVVEAPPTVVFRFYEQLDHLRYVSAERRREWCKAHDQRIDVGREYEVHINQGRHSIMLRVRTVRIDRDRCIEDEFLNWPLKGARHVQSFDAHEDGRFTTVHELNHWEPPWYAKPTVKKHEWEQTRFFEEKLANGKRVIEAVYAVRGDDAFTRSVVEEARAVGVDPVIDDDG